MEHYRIYILISPLGFPKFAFTDVSQQHSLYITPEFNENGSALFHRPLALTGPPRGVRGAWEGTGCFAGLVRAHGGLPVPPPADRGVGVTIFPPAIPSALNGSAWVT